MKIEDFERLHLSQKVKVNGKIKVITHLSYSVYDLKKNLQTLIIGFNYIKPFILGSEDIKTIEIIEDEYKENYDYYDDYEYGDPWGDKKEVE
jgi:hypothetical protein